MPTLRGRLALLRVINGGLAKSNCVCTCIYVDSHALIHCWLFCFAFHLCGTWVPPRVEMDVLGLLKGSSSKNWLIPAINRSFWCTRGSQTVGSLRFRLDFPRGHASPRANASTWGPSTFRPWQSSGRKARREQKAEGRAGNLQSRKERLAPNGFRPSTV